MEGVEAQLARRLRSKSGLAASRPWTPWDNLPDPLAQRQQHAAPAAGALRVLACGCMWRCGRSARAPW